jgi:type II secretory pathway pseudopilin PulG
LLAVMAIIGILAGVVAGSVSGLGASGQNAQIKSDTNTLETAADRFFNESFPQIYPVSDPDTNGDGLLDDNDSPPLPAGDVNVRLINFDARLPQDPTKTFTPDFVKDIPDSAALVSYRVETTTGKIFSAADGSALIPPADSRLNVNVLDKKTGNTTDVSFDLTMRKNRAAVELLKIQIPAGYIIGGQSLSPGVQVGSLEIFFDVDNPWKPGHVLKVAAPVLATGRANKWTVSPEYSTARSESDGSVVTEVKGAISFNEAGTIIRAAGPILTHQIDISSATTETPGTFFLKMDRTGGAELAHNEARETWILRLFEHPLGFSDGDAGEVIDLITNPAFDRVYRWTAQEHSTIHVEDIFEQVAGKQAVLIKDTVNEPAVTANTPPVAATQTVEVAEGVAEFIELSGIDADDDSLKFIITSLPLHGTLRDASNGQVSFTPRELFGDEVIYTSGTPGDLLADSFTFVVNDGREDSAPVTVNIEFEDIISPAVSSVDPADGAVDVLWDANVTVTFSELMNESSVGSAGAFTVTVGGAPISGDISFSGLDAIFDPDSDLLPDTTYTVTVITGVTDLNGNPLAQPFSSTFTTVPAPVTPPSGLVGWWPGEGNANDIVGPGDGTWATSPAFATGRTGQAFSFNGVDNFVDVAPGYNAGTGGLTAELWYKANVSGTTQVLLVKGLTGGTSGYELLLNGGQLVWDLQGTGGIAFNTSTAEPANNEWHHVAGVLDRSTNTAILYVDGEAVASQSANVGNIDTALNLGFGALTRQPGGTSVQFFNGLMDEISIYNRVLDAAEIRSIFDAGSAGKITDTPYISAVIPLSGGVDRDLYLPQAPLTVVLGTPPYTVSIASGSLPAGLSIASSGIISGTPTTVGTATFALLISDSTGKTVTSDPINIVVAPRPLVAIKLWDEVLPFDSGTVTTPAQAVVLAGKSVALDFSPGDTAVLSSTPDGTGPILADNFITINEVITTEPVSLTPAVDVSASIPTGSTTVLFEWRDFGGLAQTSDMYLVTTAKIFE